MKKSILTMGLMIVVAMVLVACAQAPTQEIDAAKASYEQVQATGAEKYVPEEMAEVKAKYDAAMAEIQAQDGKLFKNYDAAKQMLADVKTLSSDVAQKAVAKKEELKQAALAGQQTATQAVADAVAALAGAPRGKGTTEDIEALKADVKGLEESLPQVQVMIDAENYAEAAGTSTSITEKATQVTEQVKAAVAAIAKAKKGRKK